MSCNAFQFFSPSDKIEIHMMAPMYKSNNEANEWLNSLGRCERQKIVSIDDVRKLSNYYLVWYTMNFEGKDGYNIDGSTNYTLDAFVTDFIEGKLQTPNYITRIEKLKSLIRILRDGLNKPIEIRIAHHSSLDKSLVVDGVKRITALYYFMLKEPNILNLLLSSTYPIYLLTFISDKCNQIFPSDFKKLV